MVRGLSLVWVYLEGLQVIWSFLTVLALAIWLAWVDANRLEIRQGGELYLTRWHLWRHGFKVFVHRIHRPDSDRDPHNHPWPWGLSLILWGGYTELRVTRPELEGQPRVGVSLGQVNRWEFGPVRWLNWIGRGVYHRITWVAPNTWTLFLAGPRSREWGFWTDRGHVPYAGPELED